MPFLEKPRAFFRNLFSSRAIDADLDNEVRSHLQMLIDENLSAGMPPEEAQRAARLELGGIEQVKEQVREQRLANCLHSILSDSRFALRQLRKSPAFTSVAILTLAFGIGANTAVFSILDAVLIRPLPYPSSQRLVRLGALDLKSGLFLGKTSYPDFLDWNAQPDLFDKLAAYEEKTFNLAGISQPEHVKGSVVSPDFFETLGIPPLAGRSLAAAANQQAIVLSNSLWSRAFASDPRAIGSSVTLDGYSYEVLGVMPPGFQFPDPQTELWAAITPVRPDLREEIVARGNLEMSVIGRLNPDVSVSQAQAAMTVVASRLAQKYPASNRDFGVRLVPLPEDLVGKFRPALIILMGSAALVLLVACANLASLLLSRAVARQTEIAIRTSLGATRRRIVSQLLTESLLLSLVGGSLGVLLAFVLLQTLVAWVPADIPRISTAHLHPSVLLFTALTSVLAGILFGLAPAWQISRNNLHSSLQQTSRTAPGRKRMTKIMVVAEFALSLILLFAAGLLGKSLLLLTRVDPGFRTDHLLTVEVYRSMTDENRQVNWRNWTGFYQQLLARIQALPGVESAGATLALPLQGHTWTVGFKLEGHAYSSLLDQPQAEARIVSNNYFDVMKIPLRRGRYFSEYDTKDASHVTVINETTARIYFPDQDPVGRFIQVPAFGADQCQIVGIVADIKQNSLSDEPAPALYLPFTQEIMPWQTLVVRTKSDPLALAALIRREVAALDPAQPVARVVTLDQLLQASTAQPRFRTFLLGSFAAIALLLSAIGIYGVMAYAVSGRTREIGIRMALGAHPANILALVFSESVILTSMGVLFGLAGAYSLTRVLNSLLFGVSSTDPSTFAAVTLLLVFASLLASYIPARRATRVDPLTALRYE
ncbi:MAG TPA: ABC transporter permease [Candidatus Sulfotelmatobacter sp.]|nr:ABC transporter permease [Candidatus Sulfotelmatobacter sp.]